MCRTGRAKLGGPNYACMPRSGMCWAGSQRGVTWGSARAPPVYRKITHQTKAQSANCPMALKFFLHPAGNVVFFTSQVHYLNIMQFYLFLVHSGPLKAQAHPAAGPGHRPHLFRTKRTQDWPQTPGGWVSARTNTLGAKACMHAACAELLAIKLNQAEVVQDDLFTRKT